MKTVEQRWQELWQEVAPHEATAIQEREMRRAFFAGFLSAMCFLTEEVIEYESEMASVNAIEMLRQECIQFGRDILAGKR